MKLSCLSKSPIGLGLFKSPRKILLPIVLLSAMFPVAAASQWYDHYEKGTKQIERGQWDEAVKSISAAISQKQTPELKAITYGLQYIDEYLPYYQLGRALFLQGKYREAIENFNRCLSYGVIQRSPQYKTLVRLLEVAEILQAQSQQGGAQHPAQAEIWTALLRASYHYGQGLAGKKSEIDSLLAQSKLDDGTRRQITQWLAQLPTGQPNPPAVLPQSSPRLARQNETSSDSISMVVKNAAIAAYLQGRYRDAYQLFDRLAQVAPGEPTLADWQQRLRFELSRLDQPAAEPSVQTDTVRIESSAAPMISILEPRQEKTRFRTEKLRLAGLANDDVGIAAIELVVNGEPWHFADGSSRMRPARTAEGTYPFTVEIPLRMNENQIAITAYDLDRTPHSRTELRRYFRQPPLHHTTAFWLVVGSGLLVVAGAFAANRLIKYRITFVNRYNPYIAGAPIRNNEMFFGRQQLLDRILRTLPNNSLMVHGARRIGKTSLQFQLQRLLQERQDPEYHFVPVFIDLQGTPEEVFFAHLLEEVREQVGGTVAKTITAPVNRQAYGHREFANDLRAAIGILQKELVEHKAQAGKKVRLVFLIDEVDELNRYSERTNQRLRAIFMKTFSEQLVAVLTGSNIRKEWESESSPWYNFFEQVPMPMLAREEALRLIHDPVKGFFKFEAAAAEKIWEASQGKPFVIQKFCVRLVNLAIEKRRRTIVTPDVEAIRNEVLQDTSGQTQEVAAKFEIHSSKYEP
jgi:tetratricopeptide (TPR) repeat protein